MLRDNLVLVILNQELVESTFDDYKLSIANSEIVLRIS